MKRFETLFVLFALIAAFCCSSGCSDSIKESVYKEVYYVNGPVPPAVTPTAPTLEPSALEASKDFVNGILTNTPNSLEIFKYTPGYGQFRGVLVAGAFTGSGHIPKNGNITIDGNCKVIGGVYANGKINLTGGAMIIEDSYYLNQIIETFQPLAANTPVLISVAKDMKFRNLDASRPINLRVIPRRTHILNCYEISEQKAREGGLKP